MPKYDQIINRFRAKKLLVIGDLVLDRYIKGTVSRISPEAPVPIVLQKESFYTPGGAANVANNLSTLGADVTLLGRVGDDPEAEILRRELHKRHIHTHGVFTDDKMDTIYKTRIIAQNQQVVRLDRETNAPQPNDLITQKRIIPFIQKNFKDYHAVIVSDYGKGMIEQAVLAQVHHMAKQTNIPVVVDPKIEDLREYGQVGCITPNKKEAEVVLAAMSIEARKAFGIRSTKLNSKEEIEANGRGLLAYLGIESLLITLGEHGMYLFEHHKKPFPIATRAKEVFDVSGAGDTVISVFTLSLAAKANKRQAADIANFAAGVVVGKMGAVAIELDELRQAVRQ